MLDTDEYVNVNQKIRYGLLRSYEHVRSLAIFDSCRTPKPEDGSKEQTIKLHLGNTRGAGGTGKSTGSQYMEVYGSEEGKAVDYFSTLSEDMYNHVDLWIKTHGNPLILPDALQHLDCKTGRPLVNSRIGDTVYLDWIED